MQPARSVKGRMMPQKVPALTMQEGTGAGVEIEGARVDE